MSDTTDPAPRRTRAGERRLSGGPPGREELIALVPAGLRVAADVAWCLLVIAAALAVLVWVLSYLSLPAIALAVALLLAALMAPAVHFLVRGGVPRVLAAGLVLVAGLGILAGLITFVVTQIGAGLPELREKLNTSLDQIKTWLIEGPLAMGTEDIQQFIDQAIGYVQRYIAEGALTTAGVIGEVVTGVLLVLFILIFFLIHGERIWSFVVRIIPGHVRTSVDVAGRRGFASLVSFVRATAAVAFVDAIGIGLGLLILGVPLVVPLATLIFLGAFVPIVGAVITGTVAVLVALVTVGLIKALILLAVVVAVMQLESHVLQPLLLGRAVRLHPVAVILAITAGLVTVGVAGALLAVPLLAVVNAGARSLAQDDDVAPDDVPVLAGDGELASTPEPGDTPATGDDDAHPDEEPS